MHYRADCHLGKPADIINQQHCELRCGPPSAARADEVRRKKKASMDLLQSHPETPAHEGLCVRRPSKRMYRAAAIGVL